MNLSIQKMLGWPVLLVSVWLVCPDVYWVSNKMVRLREIFDTTFLKIKL